MTLDSIWSILDDLPEALPDQTVSQPGEAGDLAEYFERAAAFLIDLQQQYPGLAKKKLGGLNRLYLYDANDYLATLEPDVVKHWLEQPDSLRLTAAQLAAVASGWYGKRVSADRIKRRYNSPELAKRLQQLCYKHDNPTDISGCRSLPDIQKRLRRRACQSADKWTFHGEITFYSNGSVTIANHLARQDKTSSGKRRIRGIDNSAVSVEALRNVLLEYFP